MLLRVAVAWAAPESPQAPDSSSIRSSVSNPLTPLGPGDSVTLHVFGEPDMDGVLGVADDGTLRVPLAGAISVLGLSAEQAARRIEKAFKDGRYIVDPHVSLTVTLSLSQRVSVLGEVHAPGRYSIDAKTSVIDLLAEAGGTTEFASDTVYVLRTDPSGSVQRYPTNIKDLTERSSAPAGQSSGLRAGDSLFVPRAEQFYILGEVQRPGMYKLENRLTVLQAISIAGGITPRGSSRRIVAKHPSANGQSAEIKVRPDDLVEPGEVIRVKESIF